MIYTLTLNPAIDHELVVIDYEFDTVLRADSSRMDCGGKGFNVSRMLKQLNTTSTALGFVGGKSGERLEQELNALGIETDFTWVPGETRTNVSIVKADNSHYLKVNEAGPTITPDNIKDLKSKISQCAQAGDWWVLAGSLPPGVPATIYAELITIITRAEARVMLDTSGEALRLGCEAKPTLVKPNIEEARELVNQALPAEASNNDIATAVLELGPENLIISMGKAGALLATNDMQMMVSTPAIKERNPIGAGDSMVAGVVWGLSQRTTLTEALKRGIACGAATASREGTELGTHKMVSELLAAMDTD